MNINKLMKSLVTILTLSFLALYFMTSGGYYEYKLNNQNILTEEAIKQFEKDVKEGKQIIASNYIKEQKSYSNKANIFANKLSDLISNIYDKVMKFLFKQIEKTISS